MADLTSLVIALAEYVGACTLVENARDRNAQEALEEAEGEKDVG